MKTLTDQQCCEFMRMRLTFNDMVRVIYKAGYQEGLDEGFDKGYQEAVDNNVKENV